MANGETHFQDFEPSTEWIEEEGYRTFIVYLPGFKKEQLKVQVTSTGALKISGERRLADQKWSRFRQESSIPADCEVNAISAKFQEGMLYVKLPKKTTPHQEIQESKPAVLTETPNHDLHQKPTKDQSPNHPQTNNGLNGNANAGEFSRKMKENDEKSANKLASDGSEIGKVNEKIVSELVKKPKKLMNLVVAVLVAMVLVVYVTNAIRSLGIPKNTIQDQ